MKTALTHDTCCNSAFVLKGGRGKLTGSYSRFYPVSPGSPAGDPGGKNIRSLYSYSSPTMARPAASWNEMNLLGGLVGVSNGNDESLIDFLKL